MAKGDDDYCMSCGVDDGDEHAKGCSEKEYEGPEDDDWISNAYGANAHGKPQGRMEGQPFEPMDHSNSLSKGNDIGRIQHFTAGMDHGRKSVQTQDTWRNGVGNTPSGRGQ